MVTASMIEAWIANAIPGAQVTVTGEDGVHFEARVVAASFSGQSRVARQRQVYAALGDNMQEAIHALSMKTLTPEEAALSRE